MHCFGWVLSTNGGEICADLYKIETQDNEAGHIARIGSVDWVKVLKDQPVHVGRKPAVCILSTDTCT